MQLNAQNVMVFNSKQGLSNSCIQSISEDSRHNIWIATQNGLNRYDGVKMNVYRHSEKDPSSLCHDEVMCVFELDRNHILIGTASGIQIYDYPTDKFSDVPFIGIEGDTIRSRISRFCRVNIEGKERIMVCFTGYGNGEILYDDNGKPYVKHITKYNTGANNDHPEQFFQDKKGRLWIMNSTNHVYLQKKDKFVEYPEIQGTVKLCMSKSGNMYAATGFNGLFRYDEKTDKFINVASASQFGGVVYGITTWSPHRMFICTDGGGLRVYDEQTGKVTLSNLKVNDFELSTSNVKDALSDMYGNVWVGVYMKGVMMKPSGKSSFEYAGNRSIGKNSIGENAVFAISRDIDNNHIWIAPDNDGLYRISSDAVSSTHWNRKTNPGMPQGFTSIYPINSTTVLLGSFFDGLWMMTGNSFSLVTKEINHIFDIQPAEGGGYWIATMGQGVFHFKLSTKEYKQYIANWSNGAKGERVLGNPYVYRVLNSNGKLYVATAEGLNICKVTKDGTIMEMGKKLIAGTAIKHICLSKNGKSLWAASNRGLFKIDTNTYDVKKYTTDDGLSNNSIESLIEDDGKLWIGTDFGLSCMDINTEKFTNFYSDDGLQDNEFSCGAVATNGKNIYFGGIGGLTYFNNENLEEMRKENAQTRIRLVDILIGGKEIHSDDMSDGYQILEGVLDDNPVINLCHSDNHFILSLLIEGKSSIHVTYEYSIDGGDWINQGQYVNRLVFDNLDPGTYNIRIRAIALGTVSEERELTVIVHPAWYASWWAKIIYFLLFCLVGWLLFEYSRRQIQARRVIMRHRQQEEINEARIQFFMNISHEIRTPMTLILAPLEKLIGMDKDAECQRNYQLIKQNANRILRLINQMMDVRKIEQGKFLLNYKQVELVSFIQNIYDVFVTNAQSREINYQFIHNIDTLPVYLDADNMDKIVMNLLSNAFKFTPNGGSISISLETDENNNFVLAVTDTGQGIKDEDKPKVFERFYSANHQNGYIGTGIGLNLTSMLVHLHKGEITVADNPEGKGTQFVVTMPYGDESLCLIKTGNIIVEEHQADEAEQKTSELLVVDKTIDTRRKNIVLVEDDEDIRQYVHSELSADFIVNDFNNGQQAWDFVVRNPEKADLIISDIMMPVMDGLTLCQKVKSNLNTNHIPIVLMTALGSDADRIVGITNGADAYLSKPFNIDILTSTVANLLKTRQMLQGKFISERQREEKIEKVEIETADENLMNRVMTVINENMDNSELSVELVADKVGISRVHFYRKMKDLTGQAPREFIKYIRLKEAARLLSEKDIDIISVAYATGFNSASTFSTSFKGLFGVSPSEYKKRNKSE